MAKVPTVLEKAVLLSQSQPRTLLASTEFPASAGHIRGDSQSSTTESVSTGTKSTFRTRVKE